jgi:hypothetical protein
MRLKILIESFWLKPSVSTIRILCGKVRNYVRLFWRNRRWHIFMARVWRTRLEFDNTQPTNEFSNKKIFLPMRCADVWTWNPSTG